MEEWKDVVGYEDYYEVSSFGRVRAKERDVTRSDGSTVHYSSRYLNPVLNSDGYRQCKLCRDGRFVTRRVHRLVAEAFLPNPFHLSDANHKDANRENNMVDNLEWLDHKNNVLQSIHEGRHFCTRNLLGANNPNFGNTTLKQFYAEHPEKALEWMSRPGAQNGRARQIELYDANMNKIEQFDYIGGCAVFMRETFGINASINAMRTSITRAIKRNSSYHGFYFKFV